VVPSRDLVARRGDLRESAPRASANDGGDAEVVGAGAKQRIDNIAALG
jgi:hypothetical protein